MHVYDQIRERYLRGESRARIARELDLPYTMVTRAIEASVASEQIKSIEAQRQSDKSFKKHLRTNKRFAKFYKELQALDDSSEEAMQPAILDESSVDSKVRVRVRPNLHGREVPETVDGILNADRMLRRKKESGRLVFQKNRARRLRRQQDRG